MIQSQPGTDDIFRVVQPDGVIEYKLCNGRGLLHRLDGPAMECPNGTKIWYYYGQKHRFDGPAIELPNGTREFFIRDEEYSESDYWAAINEELNL
jgi:hypothetical protein